MAGKLCKVNQRQKRKNKKFSVSSVSTGPQTDTYDDCRKLFSSTAELRDFLLFSALKMLFLTNLLTHPPTHWLTTQAIVWQYSRIFSFYCTLLALKTYKKNNTRTSALVVTIAMLLCLINCRFIIIIIVSEHEVAGSTKQCVVGLAWYSDDSGRSSEVAQLHISLRENAM